MVCDHRLTAWEVNDRDAIRTLLSGDSLEVIDFREIYSDLGERLNFDFSHTLRVLDKVPLGLNGDEHLAVRRETTILFKNRKGDAETAFNDSLARCIETFVRPGGRVDLVEHLLVPSIMSMMTALSGVSSSLSDVPTLSQIFDARMSFNRRKTIEKNIRKIYEEASDRMSEEEVTLAAAIVMVGADSILATMSVSLHHELERNLGKRLDEIDWAPPFPVTGVQYVDRIATKDMDVCGERIEAGARLRLRLNVFDKPFEGDASGQFGLALHTCLGKALSIAAWKSMTEALSRIPLRVSDVNAERRRPDFLFKSLQRLEVTFG
jgi:cytochrome P450